MVEVVEAVTGWVHPVDVMGDWQLGTLEAEDERRERGGGDAGKKGGRGNWEWGRI